MLNDCCQNGMHFPPVHPDATVPNRCVMVMHTQSVVLLRVHKRPLSQLYHARKAYAIHAQQLRQRWLCENKATGAVGGMMPSDHKMPSADHKSTTKRSLSDALADASNSVVHIATYVVHPTAAPNNNHQAAVREADKGVHHEGVQQHATPPTLPPTLHTHVPQQLQSHTSASTLHAPSVLQQPSNTPSQQLPATVPTKTTKQPTTAIPPSATGTATADIINPTIQPKTATEEHIITPTLQPRPTISNSSMVFDEVLTRQVLGPHNPDARYVKGVGWV